METSPISSIYNNILKESFYFVRHGKTDWSMEDITRGPGDYSLNDTGKKQAKSAAKILANREEKENYVIVSSLLERAKQTAQKIANRIKIPVTFYPDLHERYFGDFSQLAEEEISQGAVPHDAESETSFKERVSKAIPTVMNSKEFYGKKKVIVSHSNVFRELSLNLTGKESTIDYGEVFLFTPLTDGKWMAQKIGEENGQSKE